MGIENFSNGGDDEEHVKHRSEDDVEVRPRVGKHTHEKVRDFTSRAGMNISEGYDYLIAGSLSDQGILEEILTLNREFNQPMSPMDEDLLEDIVDKWSKLGHFPSREEINSDPEMNGFPIYIIYLGKTDRIKELAKEHHPDKIPP